MGVAWVDVVGLPGVAGLWALAADPAAGGGVANLFGSLVVVACVVGSWWSGCAAGAFSGALAGGAACGWGELAAVGAGFGNHLVSAGVRTLRSMGVLVAAAMAWAMAGMMSATAPLLGFPAVFLRIASASSVVTCTSQG